MNKTNKQPKFSYRPSLFEWVLVVWIVSMLVSSLAVGQVKQLSYSDFLAEVDRNTVQQVTVFEKRIEGTLSTEKGERRFLTNRIEDPNLVNFLVQKHIKFCAASESWVDALFGWLALVFVFMLLLSAFTYKYQKEGAGGGLPGFTAIEKNRARVYVEKNIATTFADVAGADEAKEELAEVITFLKEPQAYARLGGRLPKGILLVGPPGTGKTLLARAVAGEAGVPFFSISGSEFVELFVGVGAARVRDLFTQARQKAPCIIFIDELDALGRSRAPGTFVGTHDEKEQTLNQLLVELDGFDTSTGVVLLAATNRPEILDEALLRAGRFDRQIAIDRPDKKGREEILTVHLRKVVVAPGLDIERLAALTPGCTGADLANLVNEATLLATRRKAAAVESVDFDNALERMVAGLERRNRLLTPKDRKTVAYHEMGHALVAINLGSTEEVQKVSIIPRGVSALGYTVQRPSEERFLLNKTELLNKLAALMGGRAAEMLVFGECTTGAADDLQKATALAKAMVTRYGMDKQIGLMTTADEQPKFLAIPGMEGSVASPETMREVDCAVRDMLREGLDRATLVLTQHRDWLERAARQLLHDETLMLDQIMLCKEERKLPIIVEHTPVG
jgi:cell division protease FtsH